MKGLWWKLSGVIIFLYVLAGGMTIALKPGITSVKPGNADSGDSITMSVTGYNTHFLSATHHRAWLKLDSINAVSATSIKAESENNIQLSFRIPDLFPRTERVQPLTLIMDNEKDGVFVQPNALFVRVGDSLIVEDVKWQDAGLHDFNTISGVRFPYRNILNETINYL